MSEAAFRNTVEPGHNLQPRDGTRLRLGWRLCITLLACVGALAVTSACRRASGTSGTSGASSGTEAQVVAVHDGDTVSVVIAGDLHKVRLEGIDAPERDQPFSREAKLRLAQLVHRKTVRLDVHGHDRYGRLLARIHAGNVDVNLTLVQEGLAWRFKKYSDERALAAAEDEARRARRGLWSQESPTPPWERRAKR